jgi:hypothetical protein
MREARAAENESLFRSLNETLVIDYQTYDAETGRHACLCECKNEDCFERIWLSREEYEPVRSNGRRFFVVPGHVDPNQERVVFANERYGVVEKDGEAGAVAEELDPRPY